MNLWEDAFDDMNALDSGRDELTIDQRLKIAEIKALLAIGQDLNALRLGETEPF